MCWPHGHVASSHLAAWCGAQSWMGFAPGDGASGRPDEAEAWWVLCLLWIWGFMETLTAAHWQSPEQEAYFSSCALSVVSDAENKHWNLYILFPGFCFKATFLFRKMKESFLNVFRDSFKDFFKLYPIDKNAKFVFRHAHKWTKRPLRAISHHEYTSMYSSQRCREGITHTSINAWSLDAQKWYCQCVNTILC